MNAQDRESSRSNVPTKPTVVRLLTREGQKPLTEAKPVPRSDEDHPTDEPGYGHGV